MKFDVMQVLRLVRIRAYYDLNFENKSARPPVLFCQTPSPLTVRKRKNVLSLLYHINQRKYTQENFCFNRCDYTTRLRLVQQTSPSLKRIFSSRYTIYSYKFHHLRNYTQYIMQLFMCKLLIS